MQEQNPLLPTSDILTYIAADLRYSLGFGKQGRDVARNTNSTSFRRSAT